jgi:Flp pilus assembly pilin Flp
MFGLPLDEFGWIAVIVAVAFLAIIAAVAYWLSR